MGPKRGELRRNYSQTPATKRLSAVVSAIGEPQNNAQSGGMAKLEVTGPTNTYMKEAGAAYSASKVQLNTPSATGVNKISHIQDMDNFVINEGLMDTFDQFPESVAYTFAISDNQGYLHDRKLLFLGETDNFQAWARLKSYPRKPDEIEYVRFSFLSDTFKAERNITTLPINMYPFNIIANKGSEAAKEELTVLVRYVFGEAAGVDKPFSVGDRYTFKNALVDIRKAIDATGGVAKLLNIHPPTKIPESLSPIEPHSVTEAAKANPHTERGTIGSGNSYEDSADETNSYHAPERKVFEVPATPKFKKLGKVRVLPKPKTKLKSHLKPEPQLTATAKVIPKKRRASESEDEDMRQFNELKDLEAKRMEIELERAEISERQANRKQDADQDVKRLLELSTRSKLIEDEESRLLEGKSAQWLINYQRQYGQSGV